MKMNNSINAIVMVLGLIIMIIFAIISHTYTRADTANLLSPTIVGATLFLSGYIGLNLNKNE